MGDLIISDVDEQLVQALSERAKATATTLGAAAESLLRSALRSGPDEGLGAVEILRLAGPLPRDSTVLIRRDRDGVSENELTAEQARRTVREMRSRVRDAVLPDSTPHIRLDRDA